MRRTTKGFTLIELMIVVAVVGILAAIAYPSYMNYVRKSHRAEVAQLLVEAAQNLERWYSRAGQYTPKDGVLPAYTPPAGNAWYNIKVELKDTSFFMTATPVNNTMMANDVCGGFQIDDTGQRKNVGLAPGVTPAFCWGR